MTTALDIVDRFNRTSWLKSIEEIAKEKVSEKTPQAKNSSLQKEMIRIHTIYKNLTLKSSKILIEQARIRRELLFLDQEQQNAPNIRFILIRREVVILEAQFERLRKTFFLLKEQKETLEERMVALQIMENPPAWPTDWWKEFV